MIVDGRVENCVLLELLTDQGVGTEIVGEEQLRKNGGAGKRFWIDLFYRLVSRRGR